MKIEHFALNVSDSVAMAEWYVENLAFKMVKAGSDAPFVRFIADADGCMLELYSNSSAPTFDFSQVHHLSLHLAFESDCPETDQKRLEAAGASFVEKVETPDGDTLIMMKDPWGVAVQLCKRSQRMQQ
ncbi:MAG: VOC family protein [Mangrovibacterium sp.]